VPGPDLQASDASDVANIIVGYDKSLKTANCRIVAIDQTLKKAAGIDSPVQICKEGN
jgi:hypothetical protein